MQRRDLRSSESTDSGSESLWRALLFCPGDRADRFEKALAHADHVILDLEDAVAEDEKSQARRQVTASLTSLPASRVVVRINSTDSPWYDEDVHALRGFASEAGVRPTVMLPKAETAAQVLDLDDFDVVALCETARGVMNARPIAEAPNCVALLWGSEDLALSLGAPGARDTDGRLRASSAFARQCILFAARAAGKVAIDAVFVDLDNAAGLTRETREAAALGFDAKACIHPSQVSVVHHAFAPSVPEIEWAVDLLAAAVGAPGVFRHNGQMIDAPILARARRVVASASLEKPVGDATA